MSSTRKGVSCHKRRRCRCKIGECFGMFRAAATWVGASCVFRSRMRLPGVCPVPPCIRKKRNRECWNVARRTYVPRPWWRSRIPSAASSARTCRSVPTEMPYSSAKADSGGSGVVLGHSFARTRRIRSSLTQYLQDFWARGRSSSSVESYARDLLRWFRFLWGSGREWEGSWPPLLDSPCAAAGDRDSPALRAPETRFTQIRRERGERQNASHALLLIPRGPE